MRLTTTAILMMAAITLTGCSSVQRVSNQIYDQFTAREEKTAVTVAPPQDNRSALQERAEQGDAAAQYQLGMSYCCGSGAGYNDILARKWLCHAAVQNHGAAQLAMGRWYDSRIKEKRLSTPQYLEEAYLWYLRAAANGQALADTYRDALEQDMSAAQMARARQRVEQLDQTICDERFHKAQN